MVILQLVTKRQYRGAEVFAAELSSMLGKRNHTVYFAGLYKTSENILDAKDAVNIDLNGTKSKLLSVSLLSDLIKLIRKTKPDIIQANGSDTLKYAVMAKLFLPHLKIVYRNISMISSWTKISGYKRKFNKLLFKKVDRVTSVGQQSLQDLVKTYEYPVAKTKMIRRGVPAFVFDKNTSRKKLADEFGFAVTDKILMHVGQFSPEKNHPFLINCFKNILKQEPAAKLIFVGEGKGFQEIKTLISTQQLEQQIFLAGYRDNVQELMAGADVFILGSTIEGLPGVIIEAAMQSVPAVAVNVGGVGEVVINEKTGILIDTHDAAIFSNGVLQLIQNNQLKNKLGEQANIFVKENFSLQQCVENFELLYNDMLQ